MKSSPEAKTRAKKQEKIKKAPGKNWIRETDEAPWNMKSEYTSERGPTQDCTLTLIPVKNGFLPTTVRRHDPHDLCF